MSRSLTVTTSPSTISMSKAISSAAAMAPLLILTGRAFAALVDELGSENVGRPIGTNFEIAEGSRTAFVAPRAVLQAAAGGGLTR